jgi:hypothetical protein
MGLSFLMPAMLGGAVLVALPIVLHLVMRQVPKHLVFPAVRFIVRREQANRRQLQLRHLLLLLLRAGAIALLALALARPSIKAAGSLGSQEAPVAAALVFDTSPRMAYRQDNQTRLEVAQSTAHWLLSQLPAESVVAVLESEQPAGDFAVDVGAAEQRISQLKPAATATPLPEAVENSLPLLRKKEQQRKEIYLFTDLSRGAWPTEVSGRLKSLLEDASDVAIYVIDVGVAEPHDFSLGDVRVSPEVFAKNGQVQIETEAVRIGPEEERGVAIYVLDAKGVPQPRGQKTLHWRPGEPQAIDFTLTGEDLGTHQGYLRIQGEDNLAADDTRYFTFDVRPAFRVLIAAPKPVDQSALFLSQALAPSALRKSGRARFKCETVACDQLPDRTLENYSAVCLLDPTPLDPAVWQQLAGYVKQGGGLAIWLGRDAQPIATFDSPQALALLPGKPFQRHHAPDTGVILAPRDLQHPLLAQFRPLGATVPWQSFPVWEYWELSDVDKNANVVIPYSDGRPALVERLVDRGRVLLMTTPISDTASDPDAWNQLATGFKPWPFVMLANESLLYLVGSGEERLNYLVGQRAALRLADDQTQSVFALSTPDGNEAATLTADQINHLVSVPATSAAGNYRIRAGGTEGGVDRGFSANTPLAATDLERLKPDSLDALLGTGRYRLTHGRDEIDRSVTVGRVGRELFPLLICLVALALALEHLLANRFYKRADLPPLRKAHLTEQNAPTVQPSRPTLQEVGSTERSSAPLVADRP